VKRLTEQQKMALWKGVKTLLEQMLATFKGTNSYDEMNGLFTAFMGCVDNEIAKKK
jgi:mRNA-degrading endonuclease toxin of MazEF toxin-antitoxin module